MSDGWRVRKRDITARPQPLPSSAEALIRAADGARRRDAQIARSLTGVNTPRRRRADHGDMIKTGLFLPGHRPARRRMVPVLGATAAAAVLAGTALGIALAALLRALA